MYGEFFANPQYYETFIAMVDAYRQLMTGPLTRKEQLEVMRPYYTLFLKCPANVRYCLDTQQNQFNMMLDGMKIKHPPTVHHVFGDAAKQPDDIFVCAMCGAGFKLKWKKVLDACTCEDCAKAGHVGPQEVCHKCFDNVNLTKVIMEKVSEVFNSVTPPDVVPDAETEKQKRARFN